MHDVRLTPTLTWPLPPCCHRRRTGHTYVVASGGMIKIGSSIRIAPRLHALALMSPHPMSVLGLARGTELERMLHKVCRAERVHGEWFRPESWGYIAPLFTSILRCAACTAKAPGLRGVR